MPRGKLLGLLVAGLWACSQAGGEASPQLEPGSGESADPAAPAERDVTPVARYQFVDTPDGMAIEAVSDAQVQSFSCPTRTCAGLCDECAARACQAAGEASDACALVVSSCNDSCRCQSPGAANCGFPVCALDRSVCYVGSDADEPGSGPQVPGDPSPIDFASRPGEASSSAASLP